MKAIFISWKTTLFGSMAALGYSIERYLYRQVVLPSWVQTVCGIMFFVGIVGLCMFARDHDKSSEQAGIKEKDKTA